MVDWEAAQQQEAGYWGNCLGPTAWGEFAKGEMYGREMNLFAAYGRSPTGEDLQGELDMRNARVLDVGGGPVSMTLRCINATSLVVVDPCTWPHSVHRRYRNYEIEFIQAPGEELDTALEAKRRFDEVWVYNVLQHVRDPAQVVANAAARIAPGGVLRIFEWIHIPADTCHPHVLTPAGLLNWFRGYRIVEIKIPHLKEFWSDADAFVGVFQP